MTPALLVRVLREPDALGSLTLGEWDLMLRQAISAKLSATLVCLCDDLQLTDVLPPPVRARMAWIRIVMARHADAVQFEIRCIRDAFTNFGPIVLLKGGAYAATGLDPARGRIFSDIDIMVPKAALPDAEAALLMNGWVSTVKDAYDQRYYRQWMHEIPPMQHVRRQSVIDVHHAILPETARVHPDPVRLRAAAVDVPGMPGVQTLAPADMVLHSAVHLFYDGEFDNGLRDLVDLHRMLMQFGATPDFWAGLPARAFEMELARPLFYALRYTQAMLGTAVPDAVTVALTPAAPNRLLLVLMDALFRRGLRPRHASCDDAFSGIARTALYIRGNWLRMPPLLLIRHLSHKAFIKPAQAPAV